MSDVTLEVRGHRPVPWGSNEWEWRGAIADQARAMAVPLRDIVDPTARFEVTVAFHMLPGDVARADLDNLAKPVLDTLFRPRNAQVKDGSLTGALFSGIDDDRVYRLTLEKHEVQSVEEQGATVSIAW